MKTLRHRGGSVVELLLLITVVVLTVAPISAGIGFDYGTRSCRPKETLGSDRHVETSYGSSYRH